MLDELPPYFENAASKSIGNSDLSVVTTTALSNLLVAVGRPELGNVCLVISDLRATYDTGAAQIHTALNHMEAETDRVAMNLEPVRMNTDEFYHILRKRIFETLPDNAEIEQVAQGYAQAVREAKTDGRDQRLARTVRRSNRRVLPLPSGHPGPLWTVSREPGLSADPRPDPSDARHRVTDLAVQPRPVPHRDPRHRPGEPRDPDGDQPDQQHPGKPPSPTTSRPAAPPSPRPSTPTWAAAKTPKT